MYSRGRAVGTWTKRKARSGIEVSVDLFEELDEAALARAVAELGRFEAVPLRLVSR